MDEDVHMETAPRMRYQARLLVRLLSYGGMLAVHFSGQRCRVNVVAELAALTACRFRIAQKLHTVRSSPAPAHNPAKIKRLHTESDMKRNAKGKYNKRNSLARRFYPCVCASECIRICIFERLCLYSCAQKSQ